MRVMVTGSRNWIERGLVEESLTTLCATWVMRRDSGEPFTVVHGHCKTGADKFADDWAWFWHQSEPQFVTEPERHPAKWGRDHRAAGFLRNSVMVATRPQRCLAYNRDGSQGTHDCASKAIRAGIPTYVFRAIGVAPVHLVELWLAGRLHESGPLGSIPIY